jgi:hypothetical protein
VFVWWTGVREGLPGVEVGSPGRSRGAESTPDDRGWSILRGMPPLLRPRKKKPVPEPATTGERSEKVMAGTAPEPAAPAVVESTARDDTSREPQAPVTTPPPTAGRSTGSAGSGRPRRLSDLGPVLLLRAAHPRQAALTAVGLAAAAALSGRSGKEVGVVLATVLVGQAVLGWHNDLVDRRRDFERRTPGKPVAQGLLDPGTVWFALACGVLLVVPLSISVGVTAGSAYLLSLAIGLLGNVVLRRGLLSWLPWAAAYGLYPAYLSYGGWGGDATGNPPEISVTILAALLGVGVHVLCALPGLVADHEDGLGHLPLRLALRIGATKLLVLALVWTALVLAGIAVAGASVGLAQ